MDIRICVNHLGFSPKSIKTAVVLTADGESNSPEATRYRVTDVANGRTLNEGELQWQADPFGQAALIDFTAVTAPGQYQIRIGDVRSVPFFIREDVYLRTAYDVFYYSHIQRCGQAVPGWHDACHLDDARRRDTGEHVDVTGGWHDAGDLRKWMSATMWPAIAMCWLKRRWGVTWTHYAADDILDELRWGNAYFHKMYDHGTGQVWRDTAGGLNGDNSDNHWTDNVVGTDDDRYIAVNPPSAEVQWDFVYLQALLAQTFGDSDPTYAHQCAAAAAIAFSFGMQNVYPDSTMGLGLHLLACVEMVRANINPQESRRAAEIACTELLRRQVKGDVPWAGAFRAGKEPGSDIFRHVWLSAVVPMGLFEALDAGIGCTEDTAAALRLYITSYCANLLKQSLFGIMPFGAYEQQRSPDFYRPLETQGYYRYFMPVLREQETKQPVHWWVGTSSHLLGHAALFGLAAEKLGIAECRKWAYDQLEWIVGGNVFQATMVTGHGINQPWPHSRFVGLIPGGIFNGIGGDEEDAPVLDLENGLMWQTNEYWSPHNAFYLIALSILEHPAEVNSSIGVIHGV